MHTCPRKHLTLLYFVERYPTVVKDECEGLRSSGYCFSRKNLRHHYPISTPGPFFIWLTNPADDQSADAWSPSDMPGIICVQSVCSSPDLTDIGFICPRNWSLYKLFVRFLGAMVLLPQKNSFNKSTLAIPKL